MKKLLLLSVMMFGLQACGFEIVDTGHRGVETTFGEVDMRLGSMPEGFYWYNPVTSNISEMDVRTKKWGDSTLAYTKDVQNAEIAFVLNYNLNPATAHIIFKEVGHGWADKLIPQVVNGRLKAIIGKWNAEDLINSRDKAQTEAETAIRKDLKQKNVNVTKFEITNIDYDDRFETSVLNKVVAIQKAVEEQNRTVQIQEQATQRLITARAKAKSMQIRASALKTNSALIQYEAVKAWRDGGSKMPHTLIMGEGGAVPFLQLNRK